MITGVLAIRDPIVVGIVGLSTATNPRIDFVRVIRTVIETIQHTIAITIEFIWRRDTITIIIHPVAELFRARADRRIRIITVIAGISGQGLMGIDTIQIKAEKGADLIRPVPVIVIIQITGLISITILINAIANGFSCPGIGGSI
jgi:hypothetical protein